jgi:serine/threonine protein kinase
MSDPTVRDGATTAEVAAEFPAIPGYEILQELGRGGMGVVYKARHLASQRLVALKMIRDGALAGSLDRARFRVEAEAGARMRHPNIVEIYEVGESAGRSYFAMELLEGGSLDRHLAGRRFSAGQAAELICTLARAVQHAHEQKIIHRDLKPGNILFASGGVASGPLADTANHTPLSTPQPKITDFGLAKRLDSQSTALTKDGAVVGTAHYMAPEQADGRIGEIGPATDVYALGAILYELLTGAPPFQGDSWAQAVQRVLHEEPMPPARLRPEVPQAVEAICLKCLEKDPRRRYGAASELADDLERFLAGQPTRAQPLGPLERLTRLAARDGYQIVGEIGRGPCSVMYQARYQALQQAVVLKVFRGGLCRRDDWEARLKRGAEMAAGLAHPQLISVQRAGWWDDAAYLALEHVPQGSLAARIAQHGGRHASPADALRLVEQVAEVVAYLHRQGVVHGNLKPSNVLLAADGIPRLADLRWSGGLYQDGLPGDDEQPMGLAYLAPEFLRNRASEPRPYTDIYGLGLILYELLTGRPPFTAASARELLEQVRSADPAPPSSVNPHVTGDVDWVCLKCLRKDQWRRHARVFDLVQVLRECQGEGGKAPDRVRRPGARKREH